MRRVVAMAMLAFACGETPDPGYLLNQVRVISAVPSVDGAPERAAPRPGETVTLTWGLTAPEALQPNTWAFVACPPSDQAFGIPVCGGPPFEILASVEPSTDDPRVSIEVPADYAEQSVVVLGAICVGGTVNTAIDPSSADEDTPICVRNEGIGQIAVTSIGVELTPELANLNPRIASFTLGGVELTEEVPLARQPCAGGALPEVRLDQEVPIEIVPVDGSRETFFDERFEEERAEELVNELFITEGTLDRRFTVIDDSTPIGEVEFLAEADPDDPLPAEGRTVPLIVVMRDRRGGQAEVRRGFCLLP